MASYQDIDTRLRVVEDKLDFVMKTFSITKRTPTKVTLDGKPNFIVEQKTLLDVYREIQHAGLEIINATEANNGTD